MEEIQVDQFHLRMMNRLVVEAVPEVFSEDEIGLLKEHLLQADIVKEDIMLQNFMVAKSFVHSASNSE